VTNAGAWTPAAPTATWVDGQRAAIALAGGTAALITIR
jgi:hypothetical protein